MSRGVLWGGENFLAGGEGGVLRGGREWGKALPCPVIAGAVGLYDVSGQLIVTTLGLDFGSCDWHISHDALAFDVAAFGSILLVWSKYWDGKQRGMTNMTRYMGDLQFYLPYYISRS